MSGFTSGSCHGVKSPRIVKETGCGISENTARLCYGAGAACVDVGGYGGSSWAAIESFRGKGEADGDQRLSDLGLLFREWGIPTAVSIAEVVRCGGPVIASGGIRTGIDIAKVLAMGAHLEWRCAKPACKGIDALTEVIETIEHQPRIALSPPGIAGLQIAETRWYVTGPTAEQIKRQ